MHAAGSWPLNTRFTMSLVVTGVLPPGTTTARLPTRTYLTACATGYSSEREVVIILSGGVDND